MAVVQSVLEGLWRQSWQAAVVAGLVIIIRWFFGRWIGARWRGLLWMIVLVKLILPALPGSRVSVFNLPLWVERVSGNWKTTAKGELLPMVVSRQWTVRDEVDSKSLPVVHGEIVSASTFSVRDRALIALLIVWLVGAVGSVGWIIWVNRRFWKRVAADRQEPCERWVNILNDCRREMGMRRRVGICVTDAVGSPALAGVIRPMILVPPKSLDELTPSQIRLIFLHELAHLRCGDVWMDWVWSVLLAIHWFNPILFFARSCARADRELARDAMVLRAAGPRASGEYGEALVRLVEQVSQRMSLPGVVAVVDSPGALRERVRTIAGYDGRGSRWSWLALPAVLLIAGISLTSAQTKSAEQVSIAPTAPGIDPEVQAILDRRIPDFNIPRAVPLQDAIAYAMRKAGANVVIEVDQLTDILDGKAKVGPIEMHDVKVSELLNTLLPKDSVAKLHMMLDRNVLTISSQRGLDEIAAMKKSEDYSQDDTDRKLLDRNMATFVFPKVPLNEVVKFVSEVSGAKIEIDSAALDAAGVDVKTPVTVSGNDVPASKLLDVTLRSAGAGKIGYVANDGTITISTNDVLDKMPIMRVYDLKDYVTSWPDKQKTVEEITTEIEEKVKAKMLWPDSAAIDVNTQQLIVTQTRGNQALVRDCLQEIHGTLGPEAIIRVRLLDVSNASPEAKSLLDRKLGAMETAELTPAEMDDLLRDSTKIKVINAPVVRLLQGRNHATLEAVTQIPFVSGIDPWPFTPGPAAIATPIISNAIDGSRVEVSLSNFRTDSVDFNIHARFSRLIGFTQKTIREKDPTLTIQVAKGMHGEFERTVTRAKDQCLLVRVAALDPGCAVSGGRGKSSDWTYPDAADSTEPSNQPLYCIIQATIFPNLAATKVLGDLDFHLPTTTFFH